MTRLHTTAKTLASALLISLAAPLAQADLSPADIQVIDGRSGLQVFSSDGALIGTTNGLRVSGDRARLFVRPRVGSIRRLQGRDVVITTKTDLLTLRSGALVLDADERRVRTKVQNPSSRETGPLTILLLN
ncbi:MAG: hypothetical protein AAGK77_07600 [Pseudomonadota bacterium]